MDFQDILGKSALNLRISEHITKLFGTFQMTKGETSPPPLLTEADLIALMEKHGIGGNHSSSLESVAVSCG